MRKWRNGNIYPESTGEYSVCDEEYIYTALWDGANWILDGQKIDPQFWLSQSNLPLLPL